MATEKDGRAGWELFRQSNYSLSLAQINARLEDLGYSPVSTRMYQHYGRLLQRGFRRYVTINRLDTMGMEPINRDAYATNYRFEQTAVPAQLILGSGQRRVEVLGLVTALSEIGAEVSVTNRKSVASLAEDPPVRHESMVLNLLDPARTFYGTVEDSFPLSTQEHRLDLRFATVESIVAYTGKDEFPGTQAAMVMGSADGARLDSFSQEFAWLVEAIEVSRALANEYASVLRADHAAAPTRIRRLSLASPLELLLGMSIPTLQIFASAVTWLGSAGGPANLATQVVTLNLRSHEVDRTKAETERTRSEVPRTAAETERTRAEVPRVRAETEHLRAQTRNVDAQTEAQLIRNRRDNLRLRIEEAVVESILPQDAPPQSVRLVNQKRVGALVDNLGRALDALAELGVTDLALIETMPESDEDEQA